MFEKEEKKYKGVKKNVVKKNICFQDYKDCLFNGAPKMRTMNVIRHRKHELYTEKINKKALDSSDDKRVILEDKVSTLAQSHYNIQMIDTYKNIFGFNP